MLFSVLGKNVGSGPESAIDPTKFMAKPDEETPAIIDPVEDSGDFPDVAKISWIRRRVLIRLFWKLMQMETGSCWKSF